MNESELSRDVPDWMLPLKHELYYSDQFLQGGRTFLDVGAHVGTWTLRLAPLFERVFAFEPDPRGYETLQKNIDAAGLTNVEVIPLAVSDRKGKATLTLFPNPSGNTLLDPAECRRGDEPKIGTVEVDTVSLDEFCQERGITDVDFVKVDTEGAELTIIPGAVEMFRTQRPDFFLELHGLFYERLRAVLNFEQCDIIDGGRSGLSLVRHRPSWPAFVLPGFRVYPHGTSPTLHDLEKLRESHGIQWEAPTSGLLSVEG